MIRKIGIAGPLMLAGLLMAGAGSHAADPLPPAEFRAIFNGKDLSGWYGLNLHSAIKLSGNNKTVNLQQQRAEFSKN